MQETEEQLHAPPDVHITQVDAGVAQELARRSGPQTLCYTTQSKSGRPTAGGCQRRSTQHESKVERERSGGTEVCMLIIVLR
jgi:hypothetical protein